jgi:hypothetical protein
MGNDSMSEQTPTTSVQPISQAEFDHWKGFCLDLFEQIVDARMHGRPVRVNRQPDLMQANIGQTPKFYVPSGLTHTHITL